MTRASVIIPVWNGQVFLDDCLKSLLPQITTEDEVIIVDNASTDGSAGYVAEHYPQVRLIRNSTNLGFAGGCNVGLRAAKGGWLILLNQDTEVQPHWLDALLAPFSNSHQVGIAGSLALYPNGEIQHAGGYLDPQGGTHHFQVEASSSESTFKVAYVSGASLCISRKALEAVGALDENFSPAYYEDVDWCFRTRHAGFQVVYVPGSVLIHKESSLVARPDHKGIYTFHRNRLRFVLKHWTVDRLWNEFLPAERGWLNELGVDLCVAMQHAYLWQLLSLKGILDYRMSVSDAPVEESEPLLGILLDLRSFLSFLPHVSNMTRWQSTLSDLQQHAGIHERHIPSQVPVLGGLLSLLRRAWHRLITSAYVLPIVEQQVAFNVRVGSVLEGLVQENEVLLKYLVESRREIDDLATELQGVHGQLSKSQRF